MNKNRYKTEVERRGGIDEVARLIGCGRDYIARRIQGRVPATKRDEIILAALPEAEHWLTLSKLKTSAAFRDSFRKKTLASKDSREREINFGLLKLTERVFCGVSGGRMKAANAARRTRKAAFSDVKAVALRSGDANA